MTWIKYNEANVVSKRPANKRDQKNVLKNKENRSSDCRAQRRGQGSKDQDVNEDLAMACKIADQS